MQDELEALVARLNRQEPVMAGTRRAAVSVIIDPARTPKMLLIKRAELHGDPWSGQIAFPGGKMQPGDLTVKDTASREASEEVGIDLSRSADFLGYAGAQTTHTGAMDVIPSVFALREKVEVKTNGEVASHRWVGLDELLSPEAKSMHTVDFGGKAVQMPAFMVGEYVVWGLTYRIISNLFAGG